MKIEQPKIHCVIEALTQDQKKPHEEQKAVNEQDPKLVQSRYFWLYKTFFV